MRLNQFLLLMTLTSIACGSIVASSKGLIQVKTLDAISQRELTDGTRRKLRGSLKKDDVADVEERAPISFEHFAAKFDGMVTKSKRKFKSLVEKFKNFPAKLKTPEKAKNPKNLEESKNLYSNEIFGYENRYMPPTKNTEKKLPDIEIPDNPMHKTVINVAVPKSQANAIGGTP
ncbi:unnamed protein product [Peronospora destructor]|uniref:RxLR effector protein n=1 Tax=Peronospora destructor TaxID=86335 RepID=A0AAV0TDJ5_9STRA|nr:unnamed protein product [Peronospora destructor]